MQSSRMPEIFSEAKMVLEADALLHSMFTSHLIFKEKILRKLGG